MTSKITARKACKARRAREARRKARKALKARKAREDRESVDSCAVVCGTFTFRGRPFEELMRNSRRSDSRDFLSHQKHRGAYPCGDVTKTLIDYGEPFSWLEAHTSTGFTWVALFGMDLMCVVFKKDENAARRGGYVIPRYMGSFYGCVSSNVIAEMEDLADLTIRLDRKLPPTRPFAVVCVTTSTTNVHEASSAAPDPTAAVNFIHDKIRSGTSFDDYSENIDIAIKALQLVHKQIFKADEIWVCVWNLMGRSRLRPDVIEKHLAVINGPDSGVCIEEHSHDINGGFIEKHLAVNEPDSGGSVAGPQSVAPASQSSVESKI